MRFDMAFGSATSVLDLKTYSRSPVPGEVTKFLSGQYINGVWSQALPDQRLVQPWESEMVGLINAVNAYYSVFQEGNPTLKTASKISEAISFFKDYMILKLQVMNNWGTMQASNEFYKIYYGDFVEYQKATGWIESQASLAVQESLDEGSLMVSDAFSRMSEAKADFYVNKVVPAAKYLSKDDQKFVREQFVLKMDGEVALPDLVKVLNMLRPYLTAQDFVPVSLFAPQMVLGADMASNTLNSDLSDVSYSKRNVNAEIAEITAKYNAVASRLSPYLDPSTATLFHRHIENWRSSYMYPNDSRFSVSPTGTQIMQNFFTSVYAAITDVTSKASQGSGQSATNEAIRQAAQQNALNALNTSGLSPEAAEQARAMLEQALRESEASYASDSSGYFSNMKSSMGVVAALGLGLLFILFKDKEK